MVVDQRKSQSVDKIRIYRNPRPCIYNYPISGKIDPVDLQLDYLYMEFWFNMSGGIKSFYRKHPYEFMLFGYFLCQKQTFPQYSREQCVSLTKQYFRVDDKIFPTQSLLTKFNRMEDELRKDMKSINTTSDDGSGIGS